jgi:hypothetical protein
VDDPFAKDLFGEENGASHKSVFVPTHPVRLELHQWLDAVKAAKGASPWDEETTRHYRAIFPVKAKVLPPEEARFLWRQFEMELDRIQREMAIAE